MKKYKITKFTEEEKQDIFERYGEWMKPENVVWVHSEYDKVVLSAVALFGPENAEKIEERVALCKWIKNIAEKVWTFERFKDHQMHSSPYIDSRIGEFLIRDFNDETRQRIILEEIESGAADEKGFNSDFINNRIKEMSFDDLEEEMKIRQRLSDCEAHTTPYVESRIRDYEIDDLDDEEDKRIKLEECEKLNSFFIQKRIKSYLGKIDPGIELEKRQLLAECQRHTNDYVKERIKEFQPLTFKTEFHEDLYEQLEWIQDLSECEKHTSDFIEENLKFYKGRGLEISTPAQELQHRLDLKECAKFSGDYISRETKRLKDEYLIRDPKEELKHRMNLSFFEENVKDKEKLANKDTFWDMISVHGLENMSLLKTELNSVGEGFCLAKWNQVSILLQTGQTHSCHHPRPLVVPVREL